MGNSDSVVVQKRMARFRPEQRSVIDGVFKRLQAGGPGKTLQLEALQPIISMFVVHELPAVYKLGQRSWGSEVMGFGGHGVQRSWDPAACDLSCLEDWVFRVAQVSQYLEVLVAEGLDVSLSGWTAPALLPPCRDTDWTRLTVLLDVPTLMFLAPQLPDGCSAPWRLVFSTQLHGESFTKMAAALQHHGPTLLLLRDSRGHVFGGFASTAWEHKPQFQGDSRCFLFSVFPTLRVYTATGYNKHFMYLNQHQQTMPNGLGMGGQHDYFGLWLDSDFGRGHSRARPKCTTYGNPQLSADEDFVLDAVEVWAVGKPPGEEEEEGKRSILKVNPEVQAMMELTGKTLHSEGFNELQEDFD
uniref:MTOR-associated protein MEAK7 n=1 Tax=Poecilia reticulata TaxID=8081 RepID=A0A3P9MUY1_POERE